MSPTGRREVCLNLLQAGRLRIGAALQRSLSLNLHIQQLVADALQARQADASAENLAPGLVLREFRKLRHLSGITRSIALAMLLLVALRAPCAVSSACAPMNNEVFNPPIVAKSGRPGMQLQPGARILLHLSLKRTE